MPGPIMNEVITWKSADIQRVNNYLIIKGNQLFKSTSDPKAIDRACYGLPSDPDMMDDWVRKYLDENEAKALYEYLFT